MRTSEDYDRVLVMAQRDAWQRNYDWVNGRHLLAAMILVKKNAGYMILERLLEQRGSNLVSLLGYLDDSLGMGNSDGVDQTPGYSGEVNRVFETLGKQESAEVGCDHLLCAIIEHCEIAREILERRGVTLDDVKHETEIILAF